MNQDNRNSNHLIHEKSPYLLQHAYNPVDWFPWGEEALKKAKAEEKPIFLSIGYSTCHWCHVMERESFEDEEVAKVLNEHFISIKVDKEERPDVDTIYMTVCQAITGHGGWPLTILMTAEQKPFYAGTYLPKESNGRMHGLIPLLESTTKIWKQDRKRLLDSSEDITRILKNTIGPKSNQDKQDKKVFGLAYHTFLRQFDERYGGFGNAPKFPTPHNLMFLLRYAKEYKDKKALLMVETTLQSMYRGGIYDHIGGGFSRYSTDDMWLVPHFEKMLYDNALLVLTLSECYQVTKNPLYEQIVKETLQYISNEMTDEYGGFYCAQDADSEGEEGKFYVFTPEEIFNVLGTQDGEWFCSQYDVTKQGNFEGKTILNLIENEAYYNVQQKSISMRNKLYEYRKKRVKLHKDDKILTSWNGLMITACAKAYQVFGNEEYLKMACDAYEFINETMRNKDHRLYVRYRQGDRAGLGNLEDYAFLILAQLQLYDATFEPKYLCDANKDASNMIDLFWDDYQGGFYFYGTDAKELLLRPKEVYDGAIPSGNSTAAYAIKKLSQYTRNEQLEEIASKQMQFITGEIQDYPAGYTFALCAMMLHLLDGQEIVCVLRTPAEKEQLKKLLRDVYFVNTIVLVLDEESEEQLAKLACYTKEYEKAKNDSQFYICENFSCLPPINGIQKFKEHLQRKQSE